MTLARISRPRIVWFGRRGERDRVSPPKPHPTSRTLGQMRLDFDVSASIPSELLPPLFVSSSLSTFVNKGCSG